MSLANSGASGPEYRSDKSHSGRSPRGTVTAEFGAVEGFEVMSMRWWSFLAWHLKMQYKQFKNGGSPGIGVIQQQERGDSGVLPLLREQHRTDATRSVPRPGHTQTGASRSVPRLWNAASVQALTQARLHLLVRGSHRHAGTREPRHEPQAALLF